MVSRASILVLILDWGHSQGLHRSVRVVQQRQSQHAAHLSQLLATSNSGACVVLTRMRNVAGVVEYAYLNEDCTEKALANWTEAVEYCCSIGMNLLTVSLVGKQSCLYDVLTKCFWTSDNSYKIMTVNWKLAPYEQNVEYWTSGNDLDCPGRFRWCASSFKDFAKDSLNWLEPKSNGSCVYVQLKNDSAGDPHLGTGDCAQKRRFICEARFKIFWFWCKILMFRGHHADKTTSRNKNAGGNWGMPGASWTYQKYTNLFLRPERYWIRY